MKYYFEDFTEQSYRKNIRLAKANYQFISFNEYRKPGRNVLWRHDVDLSPHRSLKLAQIEAEEQVIATYFIHLHSLFYNFFEAEVTELITKVLDLGHELGLHFDPAYYSQRQVLGHEFADWLAFEKGILERTFRKNVVAFSLHNPDTSGWPAHEQEEVGGMINTNSRYFKENYGYCSDSNGYWRYRRLFDVLTRAEEEKLQILTHPGWWSPEVMSPRSRVFRCIDGRVAAIINKYDDILAKTGRDNV